MLLSALENKSFYHLLLFGMIMAPSIGVPSKRPLEETLVKSPAVNGSAHQDYGHQRSKTRQRRSEGKAIPQALLNALYSESAAAKLWNVAYKALGSVEPPTLYPEYTDKKDFQYIYRALDFWTSGFFPGSLYLLLERQVRFSSTANSGVKPHPLQLQHLCQWWTVNLHQNATIKNTHDLGFMIAPWAMKAWSLHQDSQAYCSLVLAAYSLASRFDARVQSLRSWDVCYTKRYSYDDPSKDFLVIIDNMLNLDLLFWAAKHTGDNSLREIAIVHAKTSQKHHIRPDNTTYHVVNFDVETGLPKSKFTNQGYSDESCWARGQSWGILGFMQTYGWTQDPSFLDTARKLADLFVSKLPEDNVPYWDFDAPVEEASPRDTSAAMVTCCGLVLLYKALKDTEESIAAQHYLDIAMRILNGVVTNYMTPSTPRFKVDTSASTVPTYPENLSEEQQQHGMLTVTVENLQGGLTTGHSLGKYAETILTGATINNYEFAPRRWSDHGLVYADYYFMLLGNMLLEMGLVDVNDLDW
jgi:hypothetical protein